MRLHDHNEITRLQSVLAKSKANTSAMPLDVDAAVLAFESQVIRVVFQLLESLSGFIEFFFLLELTVLFLTFRWRFLTHLGYMLDTMLVIGTIMCEIFTQSKTLRLLGIIRVWRVFRLVNTLVDRERRAHDLTREALDIEKARVFQLQTENIAAQESLKREYESRASVERMLQGFKDEADTLREALNIAARAVAEATMQGFVGELVEDELTQPADKPTDPPLPLETLVVESDEELDEQHFQDALTVEVAG
ncbi:hypothetical protein Poli38472_001306 [Pythium oligandrum]|uniref:Hydrogen voltage-gated channel 1 n=1 Tax=Pythium oligandrum TaxID=41045 RepID=A0A8K1FMA5_PYTOL|nr:hypothetical protein Poli38472_001306 [Pythium oligandrum]|eukprot:TMW69150.1 hypothetical protein Poli38472_001306 [Pythium oligandrum]